MVKSYTIPNQFEESYILPRSAYIPSIIGLAFLAISVVLFIAFISVFNEPVDVNIKPNEKHSRAYNGLLYSFLVIGFLGWVLCIPLILEHISKGNNGIAEKLTRDKKLINSETELLEENKPESRFEIRDFDKKKNNTFL